MMIDFMCETCGGRFEHWYGSAQSGIESIPCETDGCVGTAIRYWEMKRQHSYGGLQQALVVWKRKDGTYALPAQPDARMPEEYERVELRDVFQIRNVERAIDREERERWQRTQIGKQNARQQIEAANRSELRNIMVNGGMIPDPRPGHEGERKYVAPMSAAQRDFAKFAMRENDNKPRERYSGAFFFDALSRDSSNREEGRDRDGRRVRK